MSAPPSPAESSTPKLDSYVRNTIACVIAIGGFIAIVFFWVFRSVPDAQAFSTVVTGPIGGVTGYYFGAHGKQQSEDTAKQATLKMAATKKAARHAIATSAEARGKLTGQKETLDKMEGASLPGGAHPSMVAIDALKDVERQLDLV